MDYTAHNTCPQTTRRPECILMSAPRGMHCTAINTSAYATECLCQAYNASTATGRRLESSTSTVAIQVTSIAQFVSSDFATMMTSSSSFNSVQALEATLLVIETFTGLWLGMAAVIVAFEYLRRLYRSRVDRDKHVLFQSTTGSHIQEENLESVIREYLSSFYPSVFADAPRMRRLFREMFCHHSYLQVLTLEYGFKKMVVALELLTNLTANMFLLALFYDLQWPSDNGFCQTNLSESSCLDRKSLINPSQALCGWSERGGATAQPSSPSLNLIASNSPLPSSPSGRCVWLKPTFDTTSLVLISVLVVLFSGPIYLLLNVIFHKVLLAPTESETIEEEKQVKRRRKSVILELKINTMAVSAAVQQYRNDEVNSDIEQPALEQQQQQQQLQQQQQQQVRHELEEGKKRHQVSTKQGARIFTTSTKLENSIASLSVQAQESAMRLRLFTGDSTQNIASSRASPGKGESLDANKFAEGLRGYERTLRGRDLARLRGQWPILRPDLQQDADAPTCNDLSDIAHEIEAVQTEAKELIEELKGEDSSFVGVKILDLFVKDLVGRNSRKAKIFANQSTAFQKGTVVTWGVKSLAMAVLILLNGYFIFSCMLYGRDKGINWQRGWLVASMANLCVDVMIRRVNIVLIVHYFIPTFVFDTISIVRQTINATAEKMCRAGVTAPDQHSFSAPEYLFVSNRVAKAFPGTLESSLVLAYRSATVSADQAGSWRKAGSGSQRVSSLASSISTALVNLLLIIGSQPIPLQSLMVSCVNPLVVALMAFIGTFMMRTRLLGIPIGFGIAFIIPLLFLYWLHKQYDHYRHERNTVRPDAVAPIITPTSASQNESRSHNLDDTVNSTQPNILSSSRIQPNEINQPKRVSCAADTPNTNNTRDANIKDASHATPEGREDSIASIDSEITHPSEVHPAANEAAGEAEEEGEERVAEERVAEESSGHVPSCTPHAAEEEEGGVADRVAEFIPSEEGGVADRVAKFIPSDAAASLPGCCAGSSEPQDGITHSQEVTAQPNATCRERSVEALTHPAAEGGGCAAAIDEEEIDDDQHSSMWAAKFSSDRESADAEPQPPSKPGAAPVETPAVAPVQAPKGTPEPYVWTLENANRLYDIGDVSSVHSDDTIYKDADWNYYGSDSNHSCHNLLELFGVESVDELFDVEVEAAEIDCGSDRDDCDEDENGNDDLVDEFVDDLFDADIAGDYDNGDGEAADADEVVDSGDENAEK